MLHLTRWCGVSFALHLAAATVLLLLASQDARHAPKVVTVNLEFLELQQPAAPAWVPDRVQADAAPPPKAVPAPARNALASAPPTASAAPVARPPAITNPSAPAPTQDPNPAEKPVPQPSPAIRQPGSAPASSIAKRELAQGPVQPPVIAATTARPPATSAGEPRMSAEQAKQRYAKEHFAYIRDLITGKLVYPAMARRMNWSGKTVVAFTINEDGSIQALKVAEPSGYPVLDRSALEAVKMVAPFPKPPVRAEIVIPVSFRMQER